jgi:DNA mismatch repair protein MutS
VTPSLPFYSILFDEPAQGTGNLARDEPAFFADLNLDQVIGFITRGREEYDLAPFFYTVLHSVEAIAYRHAILHDLEDKALFGSVAAFSQKMRAMRDHMSQAAKLHYRAQQQSWFLDAAGIYCDAIAALARDLTLAELRSHGLRAFRDYLAAYTQSDEFAALAAETRKLKEQLSGIRYCLHIFGDRIRVTRYDSEADYSADVAATFAKFKQGAVKDYRAKFPALADMDHVEAGILDGVIQLYPETFSALNDYCDHHHDYLDRTVAGFDREVQFYVACLEFVRYFGATGLTFCYPQVSGQSKEILGRQVFDVALASKLASEKSPVVCNDFYLKDPERIFVVSGPNQGGKTTFARTFGQMHYLASIGCLVPGSEARLFLFDRMFTHFERGENLKDLRGKLEDDLIRIHEVLDQATAASIIVLNEIFTSTTLQDAVFLGTRVLERIIQLGLLCVCVTFVDELASLGPATVSMVCAVLPENPAIRTYKIARRPADGLAYAVAIAEKYGLTYEALRERVAP